MQHTRRYRTYLRLGCAVTAAVGILTVSTAGAVVRSPRPGGAVFTSQIGVYRVATSDFSLRGVGGVIAVHYGIPGDRPVMGDWDGDRFDTVGVKRGNTYFLRNVNKAGSGDITFSYGRATDVPVVGDWNGDGRDTIAVRRGRVWYVRNSLSGGTADYRFSFGTTTDIPIAGDWNADSFTDAGVFRAGTNNWYLMTPPGVTTVAYGRPGDTPVAGDWNGDGQTTVGVRRGNVWYLSNSLSGGAADITADFGAPADVPLVGHWDPPIFTFA